MGLYTRMTHDRRLLLLGLIAGFPAVLVGMILLWTGGYTPKVEWTLTVVMLGFWLGCSFALQSLVVQPSQAISNLLAALREGYVSRPWCDRIEGGCSGPLYGRLCAPGQITTA
jgi:hypothetical protein